MTVTTNVPPPPRLTGQTDVDLAAVTSWAYAMYRVLTTDDGGLTASLAAIRADLASLSTQTASDDTALAAAQDLLATAVDDLGARLDAMAAITPVPGVFTDADLRAAINALITAAA